MVSGFLVPAHRAKNHLIDAKVVSRLARFQFKVKIAGDISHSVPYREQRRPARITYAMGISHHLSEDRQESQFS
jgi:hypothetical protein